VTGRKLRVFNLQTKNCETAIFDLDPPFVKKLHFLLLYVAFSYGYVLRRDFSKNLLMFGLFFK